MRDPRTVETLKALGGYSILLERAIDRELRALDGNPRAVYLLDTLRASMLQRIPEMRQRVQAVVARADLNPVQAPGIEGVSHSGRAPLGSGTHPEVDLAVEDLRFTGRADLLTLGPTDCVITDYKTGSPDPHHLLQLRTYALLWSRDGELNPTGTPATKLVIAYATHDDVHDGPTMEELDDLAVELTRQTADSEARLAERPPPAYPAAEMCWSCGVRHLCEDYWRSDAMTTNSPDTTPSSTFVDCEARIVERNGPRSWLISLDPRHSQALLRTAHEHTVFRPGDRIRMLGVVAGKDEETRTPIITMNQSSEVFVLRRS